MYPITTDVRPDPDLPLLRKAIDWAAAEDAKLGEFREWNQAAWARETECGTSYCIAGWVAATHPFDDDEVMVFPHEFTSGQELFVNGESESFLYYAGERLGLTYEQASDLFRATNTIADLREIATEIAAAAGEVF